MWKYTRNEHKIGLLSNTYLKVFLRNSFHTQRKYLRFPNKSIKLSQSSCKIILSSLTGTIRRETRLEFVEEEI